MKNLIIIAALIFFIPQMANTQTLADAYRLSSQRINGTARAAAMGNAFGALGGDFTSLSINPAGIGIYRTNEFVFTPVLKSNNSEFNLNGTNFTDNKFQVKANNLGFVGVAKLSASNSGVVSFNYGLGYNNIVDFNQNFYGRNNNSSVSFLDDIVSYANSEALSNGYLNQNIGSILIEDWPTKLAWDNFLINPAVDNNGDDIDGEYTSILYQDEKVNQLKSYTQTGGIDEFLLSAGLNINHQFYVGATFGFQNVDLNQLTEYTETFGDNSYTFGEDYSLKGTGYNFKFGAIFKPTNNIRLGASVHTPTYYVLDEEKEVFINSVLQENHSSYGINVYDYKLFSPWKAIFSGAYIFNKKGLISIDAEYVDYATMKYRRSSGSNQDLNDVNNDISNQFQSALNIRLGGELKLTPQFALRGGYEMYPNKQKDVPGNYVQPVSLDNSSVYAVGLGYASNSFYSDITFRNTTDKYLLNEIQPNFEDINLKNSNNKIMLTIGFKF